jgi:hypothetical protein
MKILATDSMKPKRHLVKCVGKIHDFFHRKVNMFNEQEKVFAKVTTVTSKPLLSLFKVAYRIDIKNLI